jgi:hypothetical protein
MSEILLVLEYSTTIIQYGTVIGISKRILAGIFEETPSTAGKNFQVPLPRFQIEGD